MKYFRFHNYKTNKALYTCTLIKKIAFIEI